MIGWRFESSEEGRSAQLVKNDIKVRLHNFRQVEGTVEDSNDLNRSFSWIVNNEVGIERPELHGLVCKVPSRVAQFRLVC